MCVGVCVYYSRHGDICLHSHIVGTKGKSIRFRAKTWIKIKVKVRQVVGRVRVKEDMKHASFDTGRMSKYIRKICLKFYFKQLL